MNSMPSVEQLRDSEPPFSARSDGERAGDSLPPEQVLGLLTLVASLQVSQPGQRGRSDEGSLGNLIHQLRTSDARRGGAFSCNAPVQAPISEDYHPGHPGIDFAAAPGCPVSSVMDGLVTYSGLCSGGYGNLIIVENGRIQAWYAHLSRLDTPVGRVVKSGDLIGATGSSGYGTGPHLHFEIRLDGNPIDPARFFDRGSIVEDCG